MKTLNVNTTFDEVDGVDAITIAQRDNFGKSVLVTITRDELRRVLENVEPWCVYGEEEHTWREVDHARHSTGYCAMVRDDMHVCNECYRCGYMKCEIE